MDKLDVILLMSVNPVSGGQSFIPQALDKLRKYVVVSTSLALTFVWKWTVA